MSEGVIFEDDSDAVLERPIASRSSESFLTRIVYSMGLAKTEKGAQSVMLIGALIFVLLAVAALLFGGVVKNPFSSPVSPAETGAPSEPGALP